MKRNVEHLGKRGMQTIRYAWNADIQVCVECTQSGVRAWIASVGELELLHLHLSLDRRVVGAPQMTSQSVSSIFLCSPLPSGTRRTPGP